MFRRLVGCICPPAQLEIRNFLLRSQQDLGLQGEGSPCINNPSPPNQPWPVQLQLHPRIRYAFSCGLIQCVHRHRHRRRSEMRTCLRVGGLSRQRRRVASRPGQAGVECAAKTIPHADVKPKVEEEEAGDRPRRDPPRGPRLQQGKGELGRSAQQRRLPTLFSDRHVNEDQEGCSSRDGGKDRDWE